jgi:peptidoglycan/xylan/chitin deacetylase (PgdA/CDA1 family)
MWYLLILPAAIVLIAGCGGRQATQPAPASVRVPILMYHHISDNSRWPNDARKKRLAVQPEQLAEQLDYMRRAGYTTISLDDLVAALQTGAALPDKPVILTFDDGYKDFYANAFPLLQRYSAKATIFIISGRVGDTDYMSWDDLRVLAASPLITVGAHTRHHPQLANIKPERSLEELQRGKTDLETNLHITVRHLAYPSGSYNKTTIEQAAKIGFVTAVTVHYGLTERAQNLLELPRVFVNGGTPLDDLIAGLEDRRGKPQPTQPADSS